jgi:predicted phosphodiesterase
MYFQIASDIHIEKLNVGENPPLPVITDFITPSAPNLILAGDIGSIYHNQELRHFLKSCRENFESVIFVPGNNEYYLRPGYSIKSMEELDRDLLEICNDSGVYLLNNAYIETDDLIIFGSTWWSHIPDVLNMNVNIGSRKMNPDDFNHLHTVSRCCLNTLLEMNGGSKKVLVVSHYCPTKLGTMNNHHKKDDFVNLVPYYFSSSEKYLKKNVVDTWIFGHTHVFRDFLFNGDQTRIISNADPRKKFFLRDFVISL